jgi:hypothetical protein
VSFHGGIYRHSEQNKNILHVTDKLLFKQFGELKIEACIMHELLSSFRQTENNNVPLQQVNHH